MILTLSLQPLLHPRGSWGVGAGAGVLVGVPAAVTVLVRTLGGTTPHFAPHQPEVTAAGYFLCKCRALQEPRLRFLFL